jgi:hypothetical protein
MRSAEQASVNSPNFPWSNANLSTPIGQAKKVIVEQEPVWAPIEGTSQQFAIETRCSHTLYTGTRGGGKTDVQLMRFRRRVGVGYGSFWRGVIFDVEYKNLDDIIAKSKRWFPKFNDGARFLESKGDYKWIWPTGEELLFRSFETDSDYDKYHGHEYPFIGWNELCKQRKDVGYNAMMSCNRSSFTPEKDAPINHRTGKRIDIEPIPLEVFSTTNSFGPGRLWVKQRFIDPAPYGKVVRVSVNVYNPQTQQNEAIERSQVAIFSHWRENKFLSPEYIAELALITDPNKKKSWYSGSWDVASGGALDDVWRFPVHIVPRFKIPARWRLDRSMDWGSSKPFSVGWWAEANGEEVTLEDGRVWAPQPGSLIQCAEWYGTPKIGSQEGLRMGSVDVATTILEFEQEMLALGWFARKPWPGPADNQIRQVADRSTETTEKLMADNGVFWDTSDKAPGSRAVGLQLIRDRLEASIKSEGAGLYFMENCRASIATLPNLPRDEDNSEDVDTKAEDHPYDMVRYRVLAGSSSRHPGAFETIWPV